MHEARFSARGLPSRTGTRQKGGHACRSCRGVRGVESRARQGPQGPLRPGRRRCGCRSMPRTHRHASERPRPRAPKGRVCRHCDRELHESRQCPAPGLRCHRAPGVASGLLQAILSACPGTLDLPLSRADCAQREVPSGHVPALLDQGEYIGSGAAAQIERARRAMCAEVGQQFGRRFAAVPGRVKDLPQAEVKSPEQGSAQGLSAIEIFMRSERW